MLGCALGFSALAVVSRIVVRHSPLHCLEAYIRDYSRSHFFSFSPFDTASTSHHRVIAYCRFMRPPFYNLRRFLRPSNATGDNVLNDLTDESLESLMSLLCFVCTLLNAFCPRVYKSALLQLCDADVAVCPCRLNLCCIRH